MNEATFNTKQQSKQVKEVKPPPVEPPDYLGMLSGLKRRLDMYVPFLEALRVGMWLKGSANLVAGTLIINDSRIQANSVCVANFSSSGSHSNLTTAAAHFLLTQCVAGAATITSTDSADTNTVNYIIIF
jgi:hypothetical protein